MTKAYLCSPLRFHLSIQSCLLVWYQKPQSRYHILPATGDWKMSKHCLNISMHKTVSMYLLSRIDSHFNHCWPKLSKKFDMLKKEKNNPHSKLFNEKFINLSRLLQKVKKPTHHIFSFSSSAKKFCKLKAETVEKKVIFVPQNLCVSILRQFHLGLVQTWKLLISFTQMVTDVKKNWHANVIWLNRAILV